MKDAVISVEQSRLMDLFFSIISKIRSEKLFAIRIRAKGKVNSLSSRGLSSNLPCSKRIQKYKERNIDMPYYMISQVSQVVLRQNRDLTCTQQESNQKKGIYSCYTQIIKIFMYTRHFNQIYFMGVYKLWQLLLTIAQPVSIDHLSGKILAIDASIWIVKIDSLYSSNAEKLKSILSKLMHLKRNNILPLFVFDGVAPQIKRKTLQQRYQKRLVTGEMQARKRSQIQVMRAIEGESSRMSEKSRRVKRNQGELEQLNKTLSSLSQFQEKQVNNQILQKISLQSEILNTKYKLILDLAPRVCQYENYIDPQQYQLLDLQRKMQYLDELQEYKWRALKLQRSKINNGCKTEEQKLWKDLQVIEKRSIIRQMQDNLFRKMMQKHVKIQEGFQIIQTIYNGRKIIQKRKIKDENTNSNFGFGIKKGKMKNDVNCLNFKETKLVSSDEEQDEFLADLCNYTTKSQSQPIQKKFNFDKTDDLSKKINLYKQKKAQKGKKDKTNKKYKASSQDQAELYIPFRPKQNNQTQQQPQRYVNERQLYQINPGTQEQKDEDNVDNLPTFSTHQSLHYVNFSNDNLELQNLLKILGIPFIVAPSEAEAQCAALEQMGVVDGIITQDSDVFLFGGKNVFRGVFQNNIRYYSASKIQQNLKMNREKMIIFAMLLGSDYTRGAKGIGLVNAMQIVKVFNRFQRLQQFKKWARLPDVLLPQQQKTAQLLKNTSNKEQIQFYQLHKKMKNYWYIDDEFGNKRISDAYLSPQVVKQSQIQSMKRQKVFQAKSCQKQILQKLLKEKLQMQQKQLQHYMRVLTSDWTVKRQNNLHSYFATLDSEGSFARIKSKRLQKSLQISQQ